MIHRPATIVVNYGASALLAENLTASTRPGDLVVVVDNYTTDAERAAVCDLAAAHGWLVEAPGSNLGFGTGMNLGAARALAEGATSLLLLNPDARIAPEDADRLAAAVADDPLRMVAPRINTPAGTRWAAPVMDLRLDTGENGNPAKTVPGAPVTKWISGCIVAISADLWTRIGGFDDDYFLYWEDIDLSARVQAAGGTVDALDDVVAVHDEGATHADAATGTRAKSGTYYYYNVRNRLVYAAKWCDDATYAAWRRSAVRVGYRILLQGGKKQFLTSITPWSAWFRGVRDGLTESARIRASSSRPAPASPAARP